MDYDDPSFLQLAEEHDKKRSKNNGNARKKKRKSPPPKQLSRVELERQNRFLKKFLIRFS
jgi:hypothetical protein